LKDSSNKLDSILARLSSLDEEDGLDLIYGEVDDALHQGCFDPTKLAVIHGMAFISISFVARHLLPDWHDYVARVHKHLDVVEPGRASELLMGWE
jgi:hypothetical protein